MKKKQDNAINKRIEDQFGKFFVFNAVFITFIVAAYYLERSLAVLVYFVAGYVPLNILLGEAIFGETSLFMFLWTIFFFNFWFFLFSHRDKKVRSISWIVFVTYIVSSYLIVGALSFFG